MRLEYGCVECCASEAIHARVPKRPGPGPADSTIASGLGLNLIWLEHGAVSVPVLSKTIVSTSAMRSNQRVFQENFQPRQQPLRRAKT